MSIIVEFDLRPSLGAVRDQGARSTCLAHATSVAHEKSRGSTDALSPQYLHHYAVGGAIGTGCGFAAMADALRVYGQPLETGCPYSPDEPDAAWRPPTGLHVFRRVVGQSFDHVLIRQCIERGEVAVLGIELPVTFFTLTEPWIIGSAPKLHGYHAVAAVGWGTAAGEPLVLIRNSWGLGWANAGHAWLGEDFVREHVHELLIMREEIE